MEAICLYVGLPALDPIFLAEFVRLHIVLCIRALLSLCDRRMPSSGSGSVWCTGVIDKDFWGLQTESLQHEEIVSAAVAFRAFPQSELSVLIK